mmetsp:Transcript_9959/g.17602  ORF Transcript_9959/g.17602 Transcript_9959/m.17602 type:complete len:144 (-) Transcript_9959:425-856(-)
MQQPRESPSAISLRPERGLHRGLLSSTALCRTPSDAATHLQALAELDYQLGTEIKEFKEIYDAFKATHRLQNKDICVSILPHSPRAWWKRPARIPSPQVGLGANTADQDHAAATKIQCVYRGFRVRNELNWVTQVHTEEVVPV